MNALTDAEWDALQERDPELAAEIVRAVELHELLTIENICSAAWGFGLDLKGGLSKAQRAVCRVLDGRPLGELATEPDVIELFGGPGAGGAASAMSGEAAIAALERLEGPPHMFEALAAIRSLKSIIALATAIRLTQVVDLSKLTPGETPRVPIVSLKLDLSKAVFAVLRNTIQASPVLKPLLVGKPTGNSLKLRHPSGRAVEIVCVAGAAAGAGLVSVWLAGVVFDEATRMHGQSDGIVNLDDMWSAVAGRILPGGIALFIGSPHAPLGPMYKWHKDHFGAPSQDIVVAHGRGEILNPAEWPEERREALRRRDPTAYETDCLARFLDRETALLSDGVVRKAQRTGPVVLPPDPHYDYSAAIDPATRGNAWTLVVTRGEPGGRFAVAFAKQWTPGADGVPLEPEGIFKQIAADLKPYGIQAIRTDQWAFDPMRESARRAGLFLVEETVTGQNKYEIFDRGRVLLENGELELPPDEQMREDLIRIRRVATANGFRIEFPVTADGRHCDYAPALMLSVKYRLREPRARAPLPGTPEADAAKKAADRAQVFGRVRAKQRADAKRGTFGGDTRLTPADVARLVARRKHG